jgi:hypothetical protein
MGPYIGAPFEHLVLDKMTFSAGSLFILIYGFSMHPVGWSSSAGILRVYITTAIVRDPSLASDIPLQPSLLEIILKGLGHEMNFCLGSGGLLN